MRNIMMKVWHFKYVSEGYKRPALTVDAIVLDPQGRLLLIQRGREPFKGHYALPGGFVDYREAVEKAVIRELEEETGLKGMILGLVGVYSDPDRDPRGHTVSIVFHLSVTEGALKAGDDAARARFFDIHDLPDLAFDHEMIISDFLRTRNTGHGKD